MFPTKLPIISQTPATFSNNYSVALDGTADYVEIGDLSGLESDGDLSFSLWFRTPVVSGGALGGLINVYTSFSGSVGEFYIRLANATVSYWINGEGWYKTGGVSIAADTWYHAVATYRDIDNAADVTAAKTATRLYINAAEQDAGTGSGSSFPASGDISGSGLKTIIGGYHSSSYTLNGFMDEVSIFNKVLSSEQVSDIYNSGTPTDLSEMNGLIGYWRFEEGTGSSVADSSSNSNSGTLINDSAFSSTTP